MQKKTLVVGKEGVCCANVSSISPMSTNVWLVQIGGDLSSWNNATWGDSHPRTYHLSCVPSVDITIDPEKQFPSKILLFTKPDVPGNHKDFYRNLNPEGLVILWATKKKPLTFHWQIDSPHNWGTFFHPQINPVKIPKWGPLFHCSKKNIYIYIYISGHLVVPLASQKLELGNT